MNFIYSKKQHPLNSVTYFQSALRIANSGIFLRTLSSTCFVYNSSIADVKAIQVSFDILFSQSNPITWREFLNPGYILIKIARNIFTCTSLHEWTKHSLAFLGLFMQKNCILVVCYRGIKWRGYSQVKCKIKAQWWLKAYLNHCNKNWQCFWLCSH